MGTFFVEIEVGDFAGTRWVPVEALSDTGASTSSLPGSILRGLNVEPKRENTFRFAQGEVRRMSIGQAYIRIMGEEFITDFIFNDEGTTPLLGALTLEAAYMAVDPVGQRLIPVEGLLM